MKTTKDVVESLVKWKTKEIKEINTAFINKKLVRGKRSPRQSTLIIDSQNLRFQPRKHCVVLQVAKYGQVDIIPTLPVLSYNY